MVKLQFTHIVLYSRAVCIPEALGQLISCPDHNANTTLQYSLRGSCIILHVNIMWKRFGALAVCVHYVYCHCTITLCQSIHSNCLSYCSVQGLWLPITCYVTSASMFGGMSLE